MLRTRWARLGLTMAALATLSAAPARAQEPKPRTGEKVGERVDEAASAVRRGVGRAGDKMREEFDRAKSSINAMGVESRVYGRIRWDKALEKATVDVSAARDGTITLTGSVSDASAKAKAVQLASETVGVVRVVDGLRTTSATAAP